MNAALPTVVADASVQHFGTDEYDVFHRIGALTRQLHDALRELGYETHIQGAVETLPDARARLDYIARLTGDAAEKVLNSVDCARVVQDGVDERLATLAPAWLALAGQPRGSVSPTPELVQETAAFFAHAGPASAQVQGLLTDIMMAQDFHDLTGQVIRKIANLAVHLEEQLVKLLVASTPPDKRGQVVAGELAGPVVDAAGAREVVTSQAQVDDLLAELGF
jgi:chemotaxis protein CheZ